MDELREIERAMVRIRRGQTRRRLASTSISEAGVEEHGPRAADVALFGVVDAVEEGPDGEVSVGQVGYRLGVDPSRASRLVARAVEAGYVRRTGTPSDGRVSALVLTAAGRRYAEEVHRTRRQHFEAAMHGWTPAERREFARLLSRFVAGLPGTDNVKA
jgi:DNA-binding MarR family transcriptional regulator